MQYLSKAYQYYSGINPATLTGAIDVIVVRRRDENGDYIYSCSPFHVRFGKLQVLRAGEKRVTIRLPDNDPPIPISLNNPSTSSSSPDAGPSTSASSSSSPPEDNAGGVGVGPGYEAPFWMKVGEAGEAFFVVETDEDVPFDLQTSPVVIAADAELTPPVSDEEMFDPISRGIKGKQKETGAGAGNPGGEVTPFDGGDGGVIERRGRKTNIDASAGAARSEPDFLDLESGSGLRLEEAEEKEDQEELDDDQTGDSSTRSRGLSSVSPSSILSTAATYIPAVLKPSSSSSQLNKAPRSQTPPPNPLRKEEHPEYHGAPRIKDYMKGKVERAARRMPGVGSANSGSGSSGEEGEDPADQVLPAIKDGEGEGPDVIYKRDVVLDMQGYHKVNESQSSLALEDVAALKAETAPPPAEGSASGSAAEADGSVEVASGITDSLKADLHNDITAGSDEKVTSRLIIFTQDLLASAEPAGGSGSLGLNATNGGSLTFPRMKRRIEPTMSEVERRLDHLDLGEPSPASKVEDDRIRATSEPPPELELQEGPSPDLVAQDLSNSYTWAWGELPTKTPADENGSFASPFSPISSLDPKALSISHDEIGQRRNSAPSVPQSASIMASDSSNRLSPTLRPDMERSRTQPTLTSSLEGVSRLERNDTREVADGLRAAGKLKNSEDDPYRFILDMGTSLHVFEMGSWEDGDIPIHIALDDFRAKRVTFQRFIEDAALVDSTKLVVRYNDSFLTWQNASPVMAALAIYRKSLQPPGMASSSGDGLPPLSKIGIDPSIVAVPASKGYGWSRWWRRGQVPTAAGDQVPSSELPPHSGTHKDMPSAQSEPVLDAKATSETKATPLADATAVAHYAKTLRLTSDQLKELNLREGPNKVVFSVNSSYSGIATCTARIFLWDENDHVVISDIDGTITKSDALGHVFAAIGRDWTHLGVAKLYTDICNNGYKIMYLTSRAIGQADSTRDYLKGIHQGRYQLPDGPVIMSPDRLMASLHREVIMRKPELFKMACLRDIQRLFASGKRNPFYAGFGNRITDAMSYRSVNVPASRIFTIDSGGEVKMELLELVGYKSSYIHMTDLVDQMFPPIHRKITPEYTDFNYWRPPIADFEIPDLTPVSPALSATSDSRMSVLRSLTNLGRRSSKSLAAGSDDGSINSNSRPKLLSNASRPTSPLVAAYSASDLDPDELDDPYNFDIGGRMSSNMPGSLPGSYNYKDSFLHDGTFTQEVGAEEEMDDERFHRAHSEPPLQTSYGSYEGSDGVFEAREKAERAGEGTRSPEDDDDEYPDMEFDDEMLATGEMSKVPY